METLPGDVDVVIPWVCYDETLKENLSRYGVATHPSNLWPSRYKDNGEIVYAVRSFRKFMPWVRTIHIVTNGQRPPQEALDVERVRWVVHDEFFNNPQALPSFHSTAIEANFVFIPGLAEHYISSNDDFFVGRPIAKEQMFPAEQTPQVMLEPNAIPAEPQPDDFYAQGLLYTDRKLTERCGGGQRNFLSHTPFPCTRGDWLAMWEMFGDELAAATSARFRTSHTIKTQFMHAYFRMWRRTGDASVKAQEKDPRLARIITPHDYKFVPVGDKNWAERLEKILHNPPAFYCLNDHFGLNETPIVRPILDAFYSSLDLT